MTISGHVRLLVQGVAVWAAFWVGGWPAYYQQYSPLVLGVGCTVLSTAISLAATAMLARVRPERRMSRALWLSVYYTVPFAALDALYCGVYLGHGHAYLWRYWYLTVFYVTPWLTFAPTALILRSAAR